MKTSVVILLIAVWTGSAVGSVDRPTCDKMLADSPQFRFEREYPDSQKAFRTSAPDIYAKLIALSIEHSAHPFGLRAEIPEGTPLADIAGQLVESRNRIASELESLGHEAEKGFKKTKKSITKELGGKNASRHRNPAVDQAAGFESLTYFLPASAQLINRSQYSRPIILSTWAATHQDEATTDSILGPIARSIPQIFRELRVSFCVPKALVRHVPIRMLAKEEFSTLDKVAVSRLDELELSFGVDFVFRDQNQVIRWGMVAPYEFPLSSSLSESDWFRTRISQMVAVKNKVSPLTQIQIFFVNGITADAKASIESMGVVVVGPVVKSSPPGTESALAADGSE